MKATQVRLNKTSDIQEVLMYLKEHYKILTEAEIWKKALSEHYVHIKKHYHVDNEVSPTDLMVHAASLHLIDEKEEKMNYNSQKIKPVNHGDFL